MDSNIVTLIEQSKKYNSSKTNFFKTKLFVSNNHSPNREYTKHVAQTETVQYNRYQSKEVNSGRNSKKISFNTYLLNLAKQNIDQFPKVKSDFANIQMVDLQDNRFRLFPKELYQMKKVQIMNLNSNFIKVLPDDLFENFQSLINFSISNNLVVILPKKISYWQSHLEILELSKNRLQKLYPLISLINLRSLFIQSNEFQYIPIEFQNLKKLNELGLDWFKYLNPPIDPIVNKLYIEKLFSCLEDKKNKDVEDPSQINFSDEEYSSIIGMSFQDFLVQFSNIQLNILPNPQGGDKEYSTTILHKAAVEQDIGALLSLISYYPEIVDCQDQRQNTALGLAIQEEKYFSAKALIFNGASVNTNAAKFGSILNLAIVKGQIHLILDILSQGADPNQIDEKGNTALHYCMACFDKDVSIYKQAFNALLKKNINLNALNQDGWSPLHIAVKKGNTDAISAVIQHNNMKQQKFDLNLKGGKKRQTPLHLACSNCHFEIVTILLNQSEVKLFCRNKLNQTASQCCLHNYRIYKLIKRYEYEQLYRLHRNWQIQDQDEYSVKDNDSYTDLDESIQLFDGLQLKQIKINRSVLGCRERATGCKFRFSSQPPQK
ncbi:unnamed protein product [Paramecium sonneborni]|uniref:Ankyrin repeat protein n=1 Tax=Paramecium sonneborni TaxID=65129 RepID=A0A8S1PSV4_9CILI|nr:unnamed protein product [Paramecium sonneborni]